MSILFDAEKPREVGNWYRRNEEWSEEKRKIVEILLQTEDIDVNALSFEIFSPLDIAEEQIPRTPPSIKNDLEEKGADLNVFRQRELHSTSEFYLDIRYKSFLQELVYQVFDYPKKDLNFLKGRLLTLIETFKEQIVSGKHQQGRTALHLAMAISFCSD